MNENLLDPAEDLKKLIVQNGRSERHATTLPAVVLSFDPHEHIRSDFEDDTMAMLRDFTQEDEEYNKLVAWLTHADNVFHIHQFKDYFGSSTTSAYLRLNKSEGVFEITFAFPVVDASKFATDVAILSRISTFWASLARVEISQISVFIHHSYLRWEVMEEEELLYTEYESN